MLRLWTSLALAFALTFNVGEANATSAPQAQSLFKNLSPLIYQVKTAVDANASKASYGSGFVVDREGLIATNYHVVAESVQRRGRYKTYVVVRGTSLEGSLVGIDVVHDLALVKVKTRFPEQLQIESAPPRVGARIYSVGIPQDLNLSIVDGLYNGILRYGPYEQIQMSVPINPGMSGGPTLSSDGLIVGLNVAVDRNSQNLTFSVPARHLATLLDESRKASLEGKEPEEIYKEIERQLLAVDEELSADWKRAEGQTMKLSGWELRAPAAAMKCWQVKDEDEPRKADVRLVNLKEVCGLPHKAYLKNDLTAGEYTFEYQALDNLRLNRFQFYDQLSTNFMAESFTATPLDFKYDEVTELVCDERTVINVRRVPLRIKYCFRGFLKYRSLATLWFRMATVLPRTNHALVVRGLFDGFTVPHLLGFVRDIVDSVREN